MALSDRRLAVRWALLVTCLAATPAAADIRFQLFGQGVRGGDGAACVAAGDFDEDRRTDVAVANRRSDTVTVFLSDGTGRLTPMRSGMAGITPWALVAVDFDGDSHVDVVTANAGGNSVSVLRGDGRGTFFLPLTDSTGLNPSGLAVADFDLDGRLDVAVACAGSHELRIHLGTGGFALAPGAIVPVPGGPVSVATGDVTGDGILDLAVASNVEGATTLLAGDGAGGFVAIGAVATEAGSRSVALADLDGDGNLDVAVANELRDSAFVALGDGLGGFFPPTEIPMGDGANWMVVADFDFDGRPDIASTDFVSGEVSARPGNGPRGSFGDRVAVSVRSFVTGIAPVDLNLDGALDLVAADTSFGTSANVSVLLNRSTLSCRAGNVNAGAGFITDVVFVNDSAGGSARVVRVATFESLSIFVSTPPSAAGMSPFALYAWPIIPGAGTPASKLPFGIGSTCLPAPITGGAPAPRVVWNNTGKAIAGAPSLPSSPAPSLVLNRPQAFPRSADVFVQGVIRDRGALNGRAAVTNGVAIEIR